MAISFKDKNGFIFRVFFLVMAGVMPLFLVQCGPDRDPVKHVQVPLPYGLDKLAPVISPEAMDLHYNKHYAGYLDKVNAMASAAPYAGKTLEEIIMMTAGKDQNAAIFNNAAQAWNHAFYFQCLKPDGGGGPEGRLAKMMDAAFVDYGTFKKEFMDAACGQFGSGWTWLVLKEGRLALTSTANADTPLAHGQVPLLTVDVWEHAYYLDYQNRRAEFVAAFMDRLVDWSFVATQLEAALSDEI